MFFFVYFVNISIFKSILGALNNKLVSGTSILIFICHNGVVSFFLFLQFYSFLKLYLFPLLSLNFKYKWSSNVGLCSPKNMISLLFAFRLVCKTFTFYVNKVHMYAQYTFPLFRICLLYLFLLFFVVHEKL